MNDLELEAELLTIDFRGMYVKWGSSSPLRTGMHASAVLVKEDEWCTREQVLRELFPEQGERAAWLPWDWKKSAIFENGWMLHRRIQQLHAKFGNVVWSPISVEQAEDITDHIPPALLKYYLKQVDGQWWAAELDLTHYDPDRNLHYSPDSITGFGGMRYVWEIKGINADAFYGTPRDSQGNLLDNLYNWQTGKKITPQEGLTDDLEQACRANETVHKAREQCNLYIHVLGLERGIILVENKSNQDFKLWVIEHNAELAHPYTNRMYEVKGRVALVKSQGLEKLPVRVCKSADDPRAKRCPLRKVCFEER